MATDAEQPTYDAAIAEVEAILAEIEDSTLPIDELAPRIERAAHLLVRCRGLLRTTELRVREALEALLPDGPEGGA